eukprot:15436795-Alexandrium_andersonii.AAC.1
MSWAPAGPRRPARLLSLHRCFPRLRCAQRSRCLRTCRRPGRGRCRGSRARSPGSGSGASRRCRRSPRE